MNVPTSVSLSVIWSSGNMGAGPSTIFKTADIDGDGRDEVIQLWNNNGQLGMIIYAWNGTALSLMWETNGTGQEYSLLPFLVGDINNDGREEIVQLHSLNSRLGMTVYRWNGSGIATLCSTPNIGQGAGGGFLIGDLNGDGFAKIAQYWGDGSQDGVMVGHLGLNVFGWNDSQNQMVTLSNQGAMGTYTDLWDAADLIGDGRTKLLQFTGNLTMSLWVNVFNWANQSLNNSNFQNTGQPINASCLAANLKGGGTQQELLLLWDNNGRLAIDVYGCLGTATSLTLICSTPNIGQGPNALGFLAADLNGDGADEVVQLWDNNGRLGINVYGLANNAMFTLLNNGNMGQGSGAITWLAGRLRGGTPNQPAKHDILQLWTNTVGGQNRLAGILYGIP
jgi:hypothetical protein